MDFLCHLRKLETLIIILVSLSGCHHSGALYEEAEEFPLVQGRNYEADHEYNRAEAEYLQIDDVIVRDMSLNQMLSAWNNVNATIAYAQERLREEPKSPKRHVQLATEYYKKGVLCMRYTLDNVGNYPKDFVAYEQNYYYREALLHIQRALNLEQGYPQARLLLSELYLVLSREADALEELKYLIIEYPDIARAYYAIGKIYFEIEAYDKVERYLIQALKLDPTLQDAYYLLGKFYLEQGWHEFAAHTFLETLRRNPGDSPALELLLESCYELGKSYMAQQDYQSAIKLFLAINNVEPSYEVHQSLVEARKLQEEESIQALKDLQEEENQEEDDKETSSSPQSSEEGTF